MRIPRALGFILLTGTFAVSVLGLSAAPTTIGCGSGCSGSSTIVASCTNSAGGFCVDYTGSDYTAARAQAACAAIAQVYSASPCATAGRAGTCLVYCGKPSEALYRYYANFPGAGGESQCKETLQGVWTPG